LPINIIKIDIYIKFYKLILVLNNILTACSKSSDMPIDSSISDGFNFNLSQTFLLQSTKA